MGVETFLTFSTFLKNKICYRQKYPQKVCFDIRNENLTKTADGTD